MTEAVMKKTLQQKVERSMHKMSKYNIYFLGQRTSYFSISSSLSKVRVQNTPFFRFCRFILHITSNNTYLAQQAFCIKCPVSFCSPVQKGQKWEHHAEGTYSSTCVCACLFKERKSEYGKQFPVCQLNIAISEIAKSYKM